MAIDGDRIPSRSFLNCGIPQTKMIRLKTSQGAAAVMRTRLFRFFRLVSAVSKPSGEYIFFGFQNLNRITRAVMEIKDETTPASQGPWKLAIKACGTAKASPAVRAAGQTSFIFLKPQKTASSQKGTRTEKNGSCRPTMALSWRRSRPVTPAKATIGVPSAP